MAFANFKVLGVLEFWGDLLSQFNSRSLGDCFTHQANVPITSYKSNEDVLLRNQNPQRKSY